MMPKRFKPKQAQNQVKEHLAQRGHSYLKTGLKTALLRIILPLLTVGGVIWWVGSSLPPSGQPGDSRATQSSTLPPVTLPNASAHPTTTPRPVTSTPRAAVSPQPSAPVPRPNRAMRAVAPTQGRAPVIRVALVQAANNLATGTSTAGHIRDDQGRSLGRIAANQPLEVRTDAAGGFQVGDLQVPGSAWIQADPGGYVYLDGRWYRGRLRLVANNAQLLAVNYVDLEQYLSSVVGAEVSPSWPMAALKAQAIAARSYAVAHAINPPDRFFDLGNDERWQVYQGVEDEWNTTRKAVGLTRGMVLSRSGAVLVSMYAANDQIVQEAFDGRGMSQTGALELAEQGYNHLQILGAYYPGASLARLQLK
jgi:hypothetical protein